MRVALIGNCQILGVRDALLAALPGAETVLHSTTRAETRRDADAIAASLDGYDLVLANPVGDARFGPLTRGALSGRGKLRFVPGVVFAGFHPDCAYLSDAGGALPSPIGSYHSALAAAAFLAGFSPARAEALYNPLVFARLGHFEAYGRALAALSAHFARLGYDLGERPARWRAAGAFMLSINHPRAVVLAEVAEMVLGAAGVATPGPEAMLSVMPERLGDHPVFPVFPEVASRLGVAGGRLFRGPARGDSPIAPMALGTFLERSFALYEGMAGRLAALDHPGLSVARALLGARAAA